jgi:hypothetical protein
MANKSAFDLGIFKDGQSWVAMASNQTPGEAATTQYLICDAGSTKAGLDGMEMR